MSTATLERPKRITDVTEVDVLEAAVKQLEKTDGYTDMSYWKDSHGGVVAAPGESVVACCAIGGVEQAIWKLTGDTLTRERLLAAYEGKAATRRYTSRLYAKVMRRLNAVALLTPAAKDFDPDGCPIEQLTFQREKRSVLKAFRTALEQAKAESC